MSTNSVHVFISTDDIGIARTVSRLLQEIYGHRFQLTLTDTNHLSSAEHGSSSPHLLILHADESAGESFEHCLRRYEAVPKIVISDEVRLGEAARWKGCGMLEYAVRPLDLQRFAFLVNCLTASAATRLNFDSANETTVDSPAMAEVWEQAERVAQIDATILLTGETGVGKSYLAKRIHQLSPRRQHPFAVVNCAALPETLIESELFGHRRGAFTGADLDQVGRLEQAGEATLLLDEVDTLPLASQAKLLRAVEDRVFEKVGCSQSTEFRSRLIATSNQHLRELVRKGQFRADLYYRLAVLEVQIPPLRERREEIPGFIDRFLVDYSARMRGSAPPRISSSAREILLRYEWPGNIRELRNAVEYMTAMCDGRVIDHQHLPRQIRQDTDTREAFPDGQAAGSREGSCDSLASAREQGERVLLRDVLQRFNNNRTRAARALGISRTALYKKLKKHAGDNRG